MQGAKSEGVALRGLLHIVSINRYTIVFIDFSHLHCTIVGLTRKGHEEEKEGKHSPEFHHFGDFAEGSTIFVQQW